MSVVSVLMPVYNGEQYLAEAMESILRQSFGDFEFIIVNDGSTDGTDRIIKSYSDSRIKYMNFAQNVGLSEALNAGLAVAQGKYIARMDADDLSAPTRLAAQVKFLEEHADHVAVGCFVAKLDQNRKLLVSEGGRFLDDEDLRLGLAVENVYYHGEVMFRGDVVKGQRLYYRKEAYPADDYQMWCELSKYGKLRVVEQILYLYMVNENGISQTKRALMKRKVREVSSEYVMVNGRPLKTLNEINDFANKVRKLQNKEMLFQNVWVEVDVKYYYLRFMALASRRFLFEQPWHAIYLLMYCASLDILYFVKIFWRYVISGVKFVFGKTLTRTA
jgi:glycosyltransferase involved in cell wall biosynthesis